MKLLTVPRSSAPRSPCVSMYFFRSWSQNCRNEQGRRRARQSRSRRCDVRKRANLEDKDELGIRVDDVAEADDVGVLELCWRAGDGKVSQGTS
jgi:hypothetical protein